MNLETIEFDFCGFCILTNLKNNDDKQEYRYLKKGLNDTCDMFNQKETTANVVSYVHWVK